MHRPSNGNHRHDQQDYLANIQPTHRQLQWQKMEMYAFIHFGMNTMMDREVGRGSRDPALFNPGNVDVDQWMRALVSAGMTSVILASASTMTGSACGVATPALGLLPVEGWQATSLSRVSDAAARHGLKFGVYLSPWDMTEPTYGRARPTTTFISTSSSGCSPTLCGWTGACSKGSQQQCGVYDWQHDTVARWHQAVISVCGPDVRWCGNRRGPFEPTNGRSFPLLCARPNAPQKKSQKADDDSPDRWPRATRSGVARGLGGPPVPRLVPRGGQHLDAHRLNFHHDVEDAQRR